MAAATLSRKSAAGKQPGKQTKKAPNLVELHAAIWQFASKVSGENSDRDSLKDGGVYAVKLHVAAEIEGQVYQSNFEGSVSVGHESVRASSVGATAGEVLAYLLSKMNAATRENTLREMAEVYAANGNSLPVTTAEVEAADEAMKRLRQKTESKVRGSVKVTYQVAQPGLSVVG